MFFSLLILFLVPIISLFIYLTILDYLIFRHVKKAISGKVFLYLIYVYSLFILTTLIFTTAYMLYSYYFSELGKLIYQNGETVLHFSDCFYFSASTLAIGNFGDIIAVGDLKLLATAEMLFGFLFMGIFIGISAEGFGKLAFIHLDWSRDHIIKKTSPVKKLEDTDIE